MFVICNWCADVNLFFQCALYDSLKLVKIVFPGSAFVGSQCSPNMRSVEFFLVSANFLVLWADFRGKNTVFRRKKNLLKKKIVYGSHSQTVCSSHSVWLGSFRLPRGSSAWTRVWGKMTAPGPRLIFLFFFPCQFYALNMCICLCKRDQLHSLHLKYMKPNMRENLMYVVINGLIYCL